MRRVETAEVIEDVAPSLTDTRITASINDDEKAEITDEGFSSEEVINKQASGLALEKQSRNRIFIGSFPFDLCHA
jgi:hypothetical protein